MKKLVALLLITVCILSCRKEETPSGPIYLQRVSSGIGDSYIRFEYNKEGQLSKEFRRVSLPEAMSINTYENGQLKHQKFKRIDSLYSDESHELTVEYETNKIITLTNVYDNKTPEIEHREVMYLKDGRAQYILHYRLEQNVYELVDSTSFVWKGKNLFKKEKYSLRYNTASGQVFLQHDDQKNYMLLIPYSNQVIEWFWFEMNYGCATNSVNNPTLIKDYKLNNRDTTYTSTQSLSYTYNEYGYPTQQIKNNLGYPEFKFSYITP